MTYAGNVHGAQEGGGRPRSHDPFGLDAYIAREQERLAGGPTVAEWLEQVAEHPIPGLTTERIVQMIREVRDADDPSDVG